jgi:hypothetical protein
LEDKLIEPDQALHQTKDLKDGDVATRARASRKGGGATSFNRNAL